MANLNQNRDKSWCVIDLTCNDGVYVGGYDGCSDFIEEQGSDYFLYKIVRRIDYDKRRTN